MGDITEKGSTQEPVTEAPPASEPSLPVEQAGMAEAEIPSPWVGNSFGIKVQGGTTSSAYDKMMAERLQDANKRREQDQRDKRIGNTPIEQGGGMIFENRLSDENFRPKCHVTYVGRTKEFISDQLVDFFQDEMAGDNMLIFVCPECVQRGRDSGYAQCHARDSHRAWHIDKRLAGAILSVANSAAPGGVERYVSAGMIMDTDTLACSHEFCGCAFKIHRNIMYRVK